ncbi:MAG TPA: ATP-binding SpoIIE family protein phosphatase [Candidatus Nanoarchaeia archaeon]|nr:ATP-binding SpoIIE family protein phosphatase [Candidatus Nanoarchaeia archaeon]
MNVLSHGHSISVHEESQVGEARREASSLATRLGFEQAAGGRVAIAVSEAARNLYLHGGGGEVVVSGLQWRNESCVEILAMDRGPGMQDIDKCMRDGYSTAGTPGTGLGAIARLADEFDLYSVPGKGTVLMARFLAKTTPGSRAEQQLEVSATCVAHPGEELCGDAWTHIPSANGDTLVVLDGLGHGEYAEQAAQEGLRIFRQYVNRTPTEILERMHAAMRGTRGAAVALTRIDLNQRCVVFAGIGNISAAIVSNGSSRNMVSLNGIVGHEMRKVREFEYPWSEDALLVMHSDGLGTKWDLGAYTGLSRRAPGVIAAVLYRDFSRRRDDVTVLVAREKQGQQ